MEAMYFILVMFLGAMTAVLIIAVLIKLTRDTYYHGQIDAIRGIIKYKLDRNDEGEEVWTEIKDKK